MEFRKEITESLTLKFAEAAAKRRQVGLPIISLGLGEPEFGTPEEVINATIDALKRGNSGYSNPMGILSLREKIANKLKKDNNINCSVDNIIITAGAKQAFQIIAMALLQPHDEVIVINPSFVSFIPQLLIAEPRCKVIEIDVSKLDYSLKIEEIESVISDKTKLLVINSPNNPAGYVFKESEIKALYHLATKYGFYIISDEIYEKLNYSDEPHFSIGSLEDNPKHIITINGFSKSHAMTGWRLGYACFPLNIKSIVLKIQQHTNTNTCTFVQEGMNAAFELDLSYLDEYNLKLKNRVEKYATMIRGTDRVTGIIPEAGFFAFMNINQLGTDSNTFCSNLINKTGVALTPGIAFGKNWDDHVRISFATADENIEEGLKFLKDFIITY